MAWQLPSLQIPFISSWLGGDAVSPRIPQFILDTQHPWLSVHANDLSRVADPASALCTHINDPSPRNEIKREDAQVASSLDIPADLFYKLEIDNNRVGISRYGWKNARNRLAEMKACPRALQEVQQLKIDIYVYQDSPWGILGTESRLPPKALTAMFAEVLGSMKNLKKLNYMVRGTDENAAIAKAFIDSRTELSGVEQLTVNMAAPMLIDMCPSVTCLVAKRDILWQDYELKVDEVWMKAAGQLKGLKKLHLGDVVWKDGMVDLILKETPNIEELWVGSSRRVSRYPAPDERGKMLRDLVGALTALQNLKLLHLPWSSELELGFDGGPGCGNSYLEGGGEQYRLYVRSRGIAATELAGKIVQEVFPRLKGVYIGGHYGNFTTGADGEGVVTWEWTGRFDD
ncbi:hypothetical protein ColTof3_09228 [Colletotrichum tofieldiae]|nr:hypothetical protein ColTof3_09228 [Colletotrichum tofieldiae]GKT93091.1 hypothetical protein Ct61P_10941 [Colletotrichum tofieldiae]